MRALRALAATGAVAMCAFFAIGIRQATSVNAVNALLGTGHGLSSAQQRSAASELKSAKFGYPGQDVRILAAQVAIQERRYTRAESIAESINRAEPENLQGWIQLAAAGLNVPDLHAAYRAKNEEIRLDPIDARPR
jgi:hypothetical protein